MSIAIFAAVFPLIFVAELPDKSMFASLVMSTKGRPPQPVAVFFGAAAAFLVHVAVAVTFGVVLFHLVPHRILEVIVATMFFLAAIYSYQESRSGDGETTRPATYNDPTKFRVALVAFGVIFVAEWGDLTQILVANLAAHDHSPFSVGTGALLGLWLVAAIAILGGQSILRVVNIVTVRRLMVVVLLCLTGYAAWQAVR